MNEWMVGWIDGWMDGCVKQEESRNAPASQGTYTGPRISPQFNVPTLPGALTGLSVRVKGSQITQSSAGQELRNRQDHPEVWLQRACACVCVRACACGGGVRVGGVCVCACVRAHTHAHVNSGAGQGGPVSGDRNSVGRTECA